MTHRRFAPPLAPSLPPPRAASVVLESAQRAERAGLTPIVTLLLAALLGIAVAILLGGCASEAVPSHHEREPLGPDGKADAIHGSCAVADSCEGPSSGTCYCDDRCADIGDCCVDKAATCGGPTNRLPDRTEGLAPLIAFDEAAHVVANLPYPAGNVAVASDGRVFFSFFPDANRGDAKVAELLPDGSHRAFPADLAVHDRLHAVLGVRADRQGRLWVLDHGKVGLFRPSLIAIDIATQRIVFEHVFSHAEAGLGSLLNDVVISPDGRTLYVVDQSYIAQRPAILVVELDTSGTARVRRRLESHASVAASPHDVFVGGQLVFFKRLRPSWTVDGIALSADGAQLYYAGLSSGELFRVPTSMLRTGSDAQLAAAIVKVADITATDGIIADAAGNVYLTDMEHSAITRVAPDGTIAVVMRHSRLRWPDGFAWAPDGSLYVTASALHQYMPKLILTSGDIHARAPYQIFRIRPQ